MQLKMGRLLLVFVSFLQLIFGVLSSDDFIFTKVGGGNRVLEVVDGERRVSLACAVSDSTWIGFRWTLNGISVDNNTRRHQLGPDLYFSRIDRDEDVGEYNCVATNFSSGVSKTSIPVSLGVVYISPSSSVHLSSPERSSDLRPGIDVTLKCRVEASTNDLVYEWFRNGDPIQRSERVATRGRRLQLSSISAEKDNGCYSCKVTNNLGQIAAPIGKFPLIIKDERVPKIVVVPEDTILKMGGAARFDCVFEKETQIQWFHYEIEILANSSRYSLHPNGSLTIRDVRGEDEGIYKCAGTFNTNSHPEQEPQIYSASLRLAYLDQLTASSIDPPPSVPGSVSAVAEGTVAEFYCESPQGLPPPRLWWEGPRGTPIPSESSSLFIIPNVKLDMAGNYSCVAENVEGITRTEFQLIVTSPPTIFGHPLSTIAAEGETAFFNCQFQGAEFPLSAVLWKKNGVPIFNSGSLKQAPMPMSFNDHNPKPQFPPRLTSFPENGTLKIDSVQMSDAGDYCCEIITKGHPPALSRSAQLFVTETLKFSQKPIDRKLELGSNSKLHCRAVGDPQPVIKWVKDGQPLSVWPEHVSDQNGILHFSSVRAGDKGRYTCVATNSQGIINATIKVDVVVSPKFSLLPQNPTEGLEGEFVMIHCQAYGDPMPTIQWDKNNVINGFDRKRFHVMANGSLLVAQVLKSDQAIYGCIAGNSAGFRREEVRLIVKSNDHFYSESLDDDEDAVMTRTISITLSVAAGYMFLVVGLMVWCRYRQLRRKQAYLAEIRKESGGDAELKDGMNNGVVTNILIPNGHSAKAESCRESVKSEGGKSSHSSTVGKTASVTASITSHRSAYSSRSGASGLDKISFPRQDLQFVMLLGHGDFGEVFLAKGKGLEGEGESLVMVKALQTREETPLLEYKREIDMYHKLAHENVTKLVRLCREMDPHYMIMEYSDWGDLKQFLLATRGDCVRTLPVPKPAPLTMIQILQVISQVAHGMEHISNHRFLHKDLATRNCLISSGLRIKISNPNLSKDTYSSEYFKFRNQLIPIRWHSHEAVFEDDYSTKSDVWSFSVLIWEVLHQAAIPFQNLNNDQVLSCLEKKDEKLWKELMETALPKIQVGLKNLMVNCWDHCPKNRPSFSTIVIQLSELIRDLK